MVADDPLDCPPTPPSALTREQVVGICLDFYGDLPTVEQRNAIVQLRDSDKALRHTLAQQAQEIERLEKEKLAISEHAAKLVGQCCETHLEEVKRMGFPEFVKTHPKGCEWCLQQQLAAMTAERDAFKQNALDKLKQRVAWEETVDLLQDKLTASVQEVERLRTGQGISSAEMDLAKQLATLQATLAEREATISELINRDARQQEREKNWRECFEEFKDLANGVERKYLQSHAVAIKNGLDTARQDAARLRERLAKYDVVRFKPKREVGA